MLATREPHVLIPPVPEAPDLLAPVAGGVVRRLAGTAMGTEWRVALVARQRHDLAPARAAIGRAIADVVAQMSQWETESELSRFNRLPAGAAMTISPAFAQVLDCALTLAEASGGAFDPTLGAASDAFGFGPGPPPEARPDGIPGGGWRSLSFDRAARRLIQPGPVRLDLSGIAKGFAVDLIARGLARAGFARHLVEIGGELRGAGAKPDGQPWWVAVDPVPDMPDRPVRIALSGWSVASSGDWQRRRGPAGRDWSHTLSPGDGSPLVQSPRCATVLHRGCMQADALATSMMVLGADAGIAFADRHAIPARIATAAGHIRESRAWSAMT
ncbi:FAD:protein FMN transferase [Stakelama saccharophila]|uniref:FAD:protein FMN transferase n=1 Tax=Stakelama saccharophila TaxID=3075605 RepID=A0ABZ0BBI8_9SPHN|nr:FAD:protein FMN transferase [Stakelama sp. W311]WNO54041.1 FAD:protein FMN transferase [Stakelama sp. W311]